MLQALLATYRRLPLTTLSRGSCPCTWRPTCLWSDVRIFLHLCTASELNLSLLHNKTSTVQSMNLHCFLHLCILGTCRCDVFRSIKDLSWLALPLQHDWNVHSSVCELPRVSVPFGPLALVFALRQRLPPFDERTNPVTLPPFRVVLDGGNLCCVTPDTSRILPLCCACSRHLPLPVHGDVVNGVDRLYLMHLHCSW